MSSIQMSLFFFSDSSTTCCPWSSEAGGLVLLVLGDHPLRARVDEHRLQRQVASALGGGDDERVGAVDRHVHVEEAQRPTDHAGREIVVHRERVADAAAGLCAALERSLIAMYPNVSRVRLVLVEVPARPRGVSDRAADAVGPEAVARPSPEAHPAERVVGRRTARTTGCGTPSGTPTPRRPHPCTPRPSRSRSRRRTGCQGRSST